MTFSELLSKFEGLQSNIAFPEKELSFFNYKRIKSDQLSAGSMSVVESKLLDGPLATQSTRKSFRLEFNKPPYIRKIKINRKSGLLAGSGKIQLSFFGTNTKSADLKGTWFLKDSDEIFVNSVVKAIEVSCSKPVSEILEQIHILGDEAFDPEDFQNAIVAVISDLDDQSEDFAKQIETAKQLASKGAEIEGSIKDLEEQQEELSEEFAELKKEKEILTSARDDLKSEKENLLNSIKGLSSQEQIMRDIISQLDSTIKSNRDLRTTTQKELDDILNEKSFYNVTLRGFKSETTKNFWINFGIVVALIVVALILIVGTIGFYEHALADLKTIEDDAKLYAIVTLRIGAGGLFLTVFYWLFNVLNFTFKNTLKLITDTRSIEAKLILSRHIAESVLNGESDDTKRDYATFLSLVVLKNHFMNLSEESLAFDLNIDADELATWGPMLPRKFGMDKMINELASLKKAVNKIPQKGNETASI